jgi:hypothetical protein
MPTCIVCDAHAAKLYKCSNCLVSFCSMSCYTVHRGSERCEEIAASKRQEEAKPLFERPGATSSASTKVPVSSTEDAEDHSMLKLRQCAALAQDSGILDKLKSPELQKVLSIIDNSRARLEALDAAMHNIPEFKAFCAEVLSCIDNA